MSVTLERHETGCRIALSGRVTLNSAVELQKALLDGVAAGKALDLDLEQVEEIDLAALQLLYAASRDAQRIGAAVTMRASGAASAAIGESGFDRAPDFPNESGSRA